MCIHMTNIHRWPNIFYTFNISILYLIYPLKYIFIWRYFSNSFCKSISLFRIKTISLLYSRYYHVVLVRRCMLTCATIHAAPTHIFLNSYKLRPQVYTCTQGQTATTHNTTTGIHMHTRTNCNHTQYNHRYTHAHTDKLRPYTIQPQAYTCTHRQTATIHNTTTGKHMHTRTNCDHTQYNQR